MHVKIFLEADISVPGDITTSAVPPCAGVPGDPNSRKALQIWTRKRNDALKHLDKQRQNWEKNRDKVALEKLKAEEEEKARAQVRLSRLISQSWCCEL